MNSDLGEAIIVGGDDLAEVGYEKLGDLHRIYTENKEEALRYRQKLEAHGFDTSRFQQPVLIRRRGNAMTSEERAAFMGSSHEREEETGESSFIERAYGPTLTRVIESFPSSPVVDALRLVAADWHRLRLAAREGAPWMEVTPALRAAVMAVAEAHAAQRPVEMLILEGSLVETGLTEAAYGFLRLMHADAALTQMADAAAIAERLRTCILTLETRDQKPLQSQPHGAEAFAVPGSTLPISLEDRAATVVARAPAWVENSLLETARLSATTDFDALRQVAALNDLPAIRRMKRWLEGSGKHREAAARTGVIAEMWLSDTALLLQRQLADQEGSGPIVDRILAVGQDTFSLEALGCFAAHRAAIFDALPPELRASFVRHGLDAEAWRRIGGTATGGMIDPARLLDGDMERLSAVIADAAMPLFDLDEEAFPVSRTVFSFGVAMLRPLGSGPFAAIFPIALAMTSMAILALQLKSRLRNEAAPDLQTPQAWISAFLQSGAAQLIGGLMTKIGDAVDGFAHGNEGPDLGSAVARFLQANRTGGALWYARRGADRLLWEALQHSRGRDIAAAFARMTRRSQANILPAQT